MYPTCRIEFRHSRKLCIVVLMGGTIEEGQLLQRFIIQLSTVVIEEKVSSHVQQFALGTNT